MALSTAVKSRLVLKEVVANARTDESVEDDITVEEYLERKCEEIIQEFRAHTAQLIQKLRNQYEEGAISIKSLMDNTITQAKPVCVQLKCISGPHIGQKFRLEAVGIEEEDIFKIGRSTGKLFKEKGVSIYKDKEVSTTHAKIEVKNGQAFFVDLRSTNGTTINGSECEDLIPYRLQTGDVILMGSTEIQVQIMESDDDLENITSTTL